MAMTDGMGVMPVYNLDNGSEGGFGGNFMWVIFLFFLMGWGGNGFGNNSNSNQISNEFMYSNLNSQIGRLSDQNTYNMNTLQQGLCTLGYDNLAQSKDLASEIASCCCTTQKELLINRYEAEKNAASIVDAIHKDGEATRGLMTQNTIQDLRDRLQAAEFANSQCHQTAAIVNEVRPFPKPSYITCSPYASPYGGCGNGYYF